VIPVLRGYSDMGFIKQQYDFHTQASEILTKHGYIELKTTQMDEVICDLSFPEGIVIFGPQVTVRYALFHDLLELCSEEE
jgi:hypothetical protein